MDVTFQTEKHEKCAAETVQQVQQEQVWSQSTSGSPEHHLVCPWAWAESDPLTPDECGPLMKQNSKLELSYKFSLKMVLIVKYYYF